jgi:hypothetical protein
VEEDGILGDLEDGWHAHRLGTGDDAFHLFEGDDVEGCGGLAGRSRGVDDRAGGRERHGCLPSGLD